MHVELFIHALEMMSHRFQAYRELFADFLVTQSIEMEHEHRSIDGRQFCQ